MMAPDSGQEIDGLKSSVVEVLEEGEEPLNHAELLDQISASDAELQKAVNELWREGRVTHTVDRRFELKESSEE